MKILNIKVSNFRLIHEFELDLSADNGNIVFVNGSNGRGKTTFQTALRWCFYGDSSDSKNNLSTFALRLASKKDVLSVEVQVEILMDDGQSRVFVKREQLFEKISDVEARPIGSSNLQVKIQRNKDSAQTEILGDSEEWLKVNFPPRLSRFFLFDGESMSKFFENNVKTDIENAIREIAGVDLFERIATKLWELEQNYNKKISKLSGPKAEQANKDYEDSRKILMRVSEDFDNKSNKLEEKRSERKTLDSLLSDVVGLEGASAKLAEIDRELEAEERNLRTNDSTFQSEILKWGCNGMFSDAFAALERHLLLAEKEDRLPPAFDPRQIQLLLNKGECICGHDLEPGSEYAVNLHKVIERYSISSDLGKILDDSKRLYESLKVEALGGWQLIRAKNDSVKDAKKRIQKLTSEKRDILEKLQGHDASQIKHFATVRKALDPEIENLLQEVVRLESERSTYLKLVEKLKKEFDKASVGSSETEMLHREASYSRQIAEFSANVHKLAIESVRNRLEIAVGQMFSVVKAGKFVTKITDSFEVVTLNKDGSKAILSEGENMMKAYLFSIALRDVINLEFPLVVDTPYGRLDERNRAELSAMLTKFLNKEFTNRSKQVIFSMTDSEFTPYTREHFNKLNPILKYLSSNGGEVNMKSVLGDGIDPDWYELSAWRDWKAGKIGE